MWDDVELDLQPTEDSVEFQPDSVAKVKRPTYRDGERIYCFCSKGDNGKFMIQCDICQEWYHGTCIGLSKKQADELDAYVCSVCRPPSLAVKDREKSEKLEKPEKRKSESFVKPTPKRVKDEKQETFRARALKNFIGTFTTLFEHIKASNLVFDDAYIDSVDLNDPIAFAKELEGALFETYQVIERDEPVPSDQYKAKFRSLQFNLKDVSNKRLHARILTRHPAHLSLTDLVKTPPEELGNDQVKAAVAEVRQHSLQAIFKPRQGTGQLTKKTHKGEVAIETELPPVSPSQEFLSPMEETPTESVNHHMSSVFLPAVSKHTDSLEDILAKMDTLSGQKEDPVAEISARFEADPSRFDHEKTFETDEYPMDYGSPLGPRTPPGSPPPLEVSDEYQEIIWSGKLKMPEMGQFTGFARQVCGPRMGNAIDWEDYLSLAISIEGRIPTSRVGPYISEKLAHASQMVLIEFFPQGYKGGSSGEELQVKGFKTLFEYFDSRDRYGVIGNLYMAVKDMYLITIKKNETLPSFLNLPGEDCYKPESRNRLFGLLVFSKDRQKGQRVKPKVRKPSQTEVKRDPQPNPLPNPLGLPSLLGVGNGLVSSLNLNPFTPSYSSPSTLPTSSNTPVTDVSHLLSQFSNMQPNASLLSSLSRHLQ